MSALSYRRASTRGFTLLEVLVSIGIIALIGTVIYGTFIGMSRSRGTMEHISERYHQGRSATERMARELSSAFLSAHVSLDQQALQQQQLRTVFIGSDDGRADRVDFSSFSHRRLQRDSHESDQNELSYFGARDRVTGNLDLVRRESRYIDDDPTRGGVIQVMVENIDSFDVKYLDPLTGEWLASWDSSQPAAQLGRLPSQIWIILVINDGPGGAPVKFETKVPLAMMLPLKLAG